MKTTLDRFGRVVVPKSLRDQLGLRAGSAVEIEEESGQLHLRPLDDEPPVTVKEGILVFTGAARGDRSRVGGYRTSHGTPATRLRHATPMKVFFDTSVLVAGFVGEHPRHDRAFDRLRRGRSGECRMLTSTHTPAELYAVLTTLPVSPRIPPATAARMIRENMEGHVDILPLTAPDYREVLRQLGEAGLAGGIVYDALACRAVVKGGADLILTLNPRDFNRVRPADGPRVEEP